MLCNADHECQVAFHEAIEDAVKTFVVGRCVQVLGNESDRGRKREKLNDALAYLDKVELKEECLDKTFLDAIVKGRRI